MTWIPHDGPGTVTRSTRRRASALLVALMAAVMSGCALRGAPSFALFGAFFPAWLLVSCVGVLAAVGTRIAFVATRLADAIPVQLLVCVSSGVTVGVITWLLWFER